MFIPRMQELFMLRMVYRRFCMKVVRPNTHSHMHTDTKERTVAVCLFSVVWLVSPYQTGFVNSFPGLWLLKHEERIVCDWYCDFFIWLQTYLQSLTIRLEEMRVKRRDSEQWMHHRLLPQELRERVRRYDQYKWLATRGVDEESLVQSLPKDLRRDIKRHLCLALVRRVCCQTLEN